MFLFGVLHVGIICAAVGASMWAMIGYTRVRPFIYRQQLLDVMLSSWSIALLGSVLIGPLLAIGDIDWLYYLAGVVTGFCWVAAVFGVIYAINSRNRITAVRADQPNA